MIPIKDLSLWYENARFPDKYFNKSEEELIQYFCSHKNFKILSLAEEIANEFDLPQMEKLIVYRIGDSHIVLEGNRRIAAYKLMSNPKLIQDAILQDKFDALGSKIGITDDFKIECLVSESEEECVRYLERKHLKGNNEISWGDNERAHHKARRGNANRKELLKVGIAKIIKNLDIPETMKEQVLGPGYVTTFWRMIEQSPAWEVFGFDLDDDGNLHMQDESGFKNKLKVIISDVLQNSKHNDKPFSRLKVDDIKNYLGSITDEDVSNAENAIKKNTTKNLFGSETTNIISGSKKKSNPKSTSRNYLIPKTCIFKIDEKKINNIYRELRDDLLIDDSKSAVPNAVGVLFRVFLEISIDFFWEKRNSQTFPKDTKLAGKITKVADLMEQNGIATSVQLKNIRRVATDKNNLLAIEGFHSYVHSYKTHPTSGDLKSKWDNLEEFFEILWNSLQTKQ